jgi:thiamine-monophosphate kinase
VKSPTVADIGEFELIDALKEALPPQVLRNQSLYLGIGDDAALWLPSEREDLFVTTDSMVENVHFRLDWTDWKSLGHKLLAVNLSDIAAMGGTPKFAVVTLCLRGTERVSDLVKMYRGLGALAKKYRVAIIGGDIVRSPNALVFHVTAAGNTRNFGHLLPRRGAKPGQIIGVSGTLGAAAAGMRLLAEGGPKAKAATADLLIEAHLRPEPRVKLGAALVKHGATSCMDLSDGLFGDLPKIMLASQVGAVINESAIPVAAAVRALFPDDWFDLATRGGEDYELLFTASPEKFDVIRVEAGWLGMTVTAIGEVTGEPEYRLRRADGTSTQIRAGAFDHFRSS